MQTTRSSVESGRAALKIWEGVNMRNGMWSTDGLNGDSEKRHLPIANRYDIDAGSGWSRVIGAGLVIAALAGFALWLVQP